MGHARANSHEQTPDGDARLCLPGPPGPLHPAPKEVRDEAHLSVVFHPAHGDCPTRKRPLLGGAALLITFVVAALAALVLNPFGSHAQNANVTISFDMVPAGNDYCGGDSFRSDGVTPCSPANSMTVGSVEFCSSKPRC